MFDTAMRDIAYNRAAFARDMEYMRENTRDAEVQESMLLFESCGEGIRMESDIISKEEAADLKEAIESIPDDSSDKEAEIDRILNTDKERMSIDEVMGIDHDMGDDDGINMDAIAGMLNSDEEE